MSNVLLVACYESGFQPASVARPAALMRRQGLNVVTADLSVQSLRDIPAADVACIAISAPMHTALRLGVAAARALRTRHPGVPIGFYGLYAGLNAEYLRTAGLADAIWTGELEEDLADWARTVVARQAGARAPGSMEPRLIRQHLPAPDRRGLPPLAAYARFVAADGAVVMAGQVEASRGCLHTCLHCPVVPIYGGRFFVMDFDAATTDMRQQIEAGARHISFGDPDFLNGPKHSLRLAEWLHAHDPRVTFDFTAKVEHLLRYPQYVEAFKTLGAAFVASAFESIHDSVLAKLDKGHSVADMERVVSFLRAVELPLHPTWIPFTPWSSPEGYIQFLAWIEERGFVNAVAPLQLSLRLLIPPRSGLLKRFSACAWLGELQPDQFAYAWRHPNPAVDALQRRLEALTNASGTGWNHASVFRQARALAYEAAGRTDVPDSLLPQRPPPPRLTEDWFC